MATKCIHEYYLDFSDFEITYAGNDFDVLAQPVVIKGKYMGLTATLLCLDYFNLAPLKAAIDAFEAQRCEAMMGVTANG